MARNGDLSGPPLRLMHVDQLLVDPERAESEKLTRAAIEARLRGDRIASDDLNRQATAIYQRLSPEPEAAPSAPAPIRCRRRSAMSVSRDFCARSAAFRLGALMFRSACP
jgi:hypothetical protein